MKQRRDPALAWSALVGQWRLRSLTAFGSSDSSPERKCLGKSSLPGGTEQEHAISFRWRPFLNDSDDDFVLELALAANVHYIVTHNLRNFARVESFGVKAITPAQMLLNLQATK
ncbi:MAG: PIN domain-containing protein [Verrucomicrobiota bacterium]